VAALAGLAADEAHMMFTNLITPIGLIKSGRVIATAVSTKKRQPALPDTPTMNKPD
jgi:tripartite-type tricarboxylate transporter receptor subunit TctC